MELTKNGPPIFTTRFNFEIIESIIITLASKAEQPPHEKKISPLECVEDGQS